MRNLVLFVAALGVGVLGFLIGSWSGRGAKEALARIEMSAKASEEQFQQTTKTLQDKLAVLNTEHAQNTKQLEADIKKQKADFDSVMQGRNQRIAELEKTSAGIRTEIAKAKVRLASATTAAEKQEATTAICDLEKREQQVTTVVRGEQCADVRVPPSLLAVLRGSAP